MAYHEEPIAGQTDATGACTIPLGPILQNDDVFFLGYVTAECIDGSAANYRLVNPKTGGKLGGFAGQMAVVGPMYLKPQEFWNLVVNNGPPNTVITGAIVGDVHTDFNQLQLRPVPTAAGASVGLPTFPSIVVTGDGDIQGDLTVEGAARFKGPDPWIDVTNPAYGAQGDGVTDDTSAIQSALNAAPPGATVFLPPLGANKFYLFSSLTIPAGVKLRGAGWYWLRDSLGVFGSAANVNAGNWGGSVLKSNLAAGTAITSTTAVTEQGAQLEEFLLVGPGSGTATGIVEGSITQAPVEVRWNNVGVLNFATGVKHVQVEDSHFWGLCIHGCTSGLVRSNAANQNGYYGLDIQKCVSADADDATCVANAFYSPIYQANTGTAVAISGSRNAFYNPYFENPAGARALDVVSGVGNRFDTPFFNDVTHDTVRVQAAASLTTFVGLSPGVPIANAGAYSTFINCQTVQLTDTGTDTVQLGGDSSPALNAAADTLLLNSRTFNRILGLLANDATSLVAELGGGADGTLGALLALVYAHPSAAAANRYMALRSGDSGNWRLLKLNDAGGDLQFGTAGAKEGFFGAAPVAQPNIVGAKAGNVALANLLTALANLGLLTDATT